MEKEAFIVVNKVRCKVCLDYISSKYRHDFKECTCKSTSVDGGLDYLKRSGKKYIELSLNSNDSIEDIREHLLRNGTTLIKDMSNEWLENCISYERSYKPNNPFIEIYEKEHKYRELNKIFIKH